MNLLAKKVKKYHSNPLEELIFEVKTAIHKLFPETKGLIDDLVFNTPPSHIQADYSFSTYSLSEFIKKNPAVIADNIAVYLLKNPISRMKNVFTAGSYINLEIDKKLFYKDVVKHIYDQGEQFGIYNNKNSQLIHCNYIYLNLSSTKLDDFRILLVGQSIGRHYESNGSKVYHQNFNFNKDRFVLGGRKIVKDVLRHNLAEYIADTNAIMTLPGVANTSSFILQRHDKSITDYALYLAYTKYLLETKHISTLIYISPKGQMGLIGSLINNAGIMGYIPQGVKIETLYIEESNDHYSFSKKDKSLRYALLRTPINEHMSLSSESFSSYFLIKNLINKTFKSSRTTNVDEAFFIARLLITFPMVVANVRDSHKLDHLCNYLEQVADLFKKKAFDQDKHLSKITSIVLQNGLRLLTL